MKKTKQSIIYNELKRAGDRGVHSFDLNRIAQTTRTAARIQDLKDLGLSIISKKEKLGNAWGVRYYLGEKTPVQAGTVPQIQPQKKTYVFNEATQSCREVITA